MNTEDHQLQIDLLDELPSKIHQAAFNHFQQINDLKNICKLAVDLKCSAVCTGLSNITYARKFIGGCSSTKLITCVGFPFGDTPNCLKIKDAEWALSEGAEEIDLVPNFNYLFDGDLSKFGEEIFSICSMNVPVRLIVNSHYLDDEKLNNGI